MTATALKWIALLTMIIDHVGLTFFPSMMIFRIIGRLSFPIFAFLLVQGFSHTRNKTNYLIRLLLFTVISEIPYDLFTSHTMFNWFNQSIMWELSIGFLALIFLERTRKNSAYFLLVIAMIFLSVFTYASYGAFGITMIVLFYMLRKYRGADILGFLGVLYLFYGFMNWGFSIEGYHYNVLSINSIQMYAGFAAVPLVFYSGKKGGSSYKWLFYFIYPVHLGLIYFIDTVILPMF